MRTSNYEIDDSYRDRFANWDRDRFTKDGDVVLEVVGGKITPDASDEIRRRKLKDIDDIPTGEKSSRRFPIPDRAPRQPAKAVASAPPRSNKVRTPPNAVEAAKVPSAKRFNKRNLKYDLDKILALAREGKSSVQIAEIMGCQRSTVWRATSKCKVKLPTKRLDVEPGKKFGNWIVIAELPQVGWMRWLSVRCEKCGTESNRRLREVCRRNISCRCASRTAPEVRDRIFEMRKAYAKLEDIAAAVNLNRSTVTRILKRGDPNAKS